MTRRVLTIAAVLLLFGAGGAALLLVKREPAPTAVGRNVHAPPKPTLYCDFYNFMHSSTVASFYFDVDLSNREMPRYSELFVVENEGQKTDFGGADQPPPPQWTYQVEDGTPTIAAPDNATRIVLYGLKPKTGGVFWVEAGVRSNSYRNLEGKCRQAHYGPAPAADAKP